MSRTCKIDGVSKQVRYNAAAKLGTLPYDRSVFKYIGDGVVYAVDGVLQPGRVRLSFFKLRKNRPRWAR